MKRIAVLITFAAALAAQNSVALAVNNSRQSAGTIKTLTILVKSDSEHAKKGPDGKWHDAFLPANPVVTADVNTRVTLINYDSGAHSIVAPGLYLNVVVPGAKGKVPGRVTFTLDAKKAGRYDWWCEMPCDPWSMTHNGYMRGAIVVVKR